MVRFFENDVIFSPIEYINDDLQSTSFGLLLTRCKRFFLLLAMIRYVFLTEINSKLNQFYPNQSYSGHDSIYTQVLVFNNDPVSWLICEVFLVD